MTKFPDTYRANDRPQWATLCFERSPEFKLHNSLGLAHSALANKKPGRDVALYHLEAVEGGFEWVKTWEYIVPVYCPVCHRLMDSPRVPLTHHGTVKDAPVVCYDCYREDYEREKQRENEKRDLAKLAELQRMYPNY